MDEIDPRVVRRYELTDESERLWRPGRGDLIRLRTWDIFDRFLPPAGHVLDVGGGPGDHAEHLAGLGYDLTLVDPVADHVVRAKHRARNAAQTFEVVKGIAGNLPVEGECADAVLLMGPLYHLVSPPNRQVALAEARRVLRPGGRLLAEIISRHAWLLDATIRQNLAEPDIWKAIEHSIETGLSQDPTDVTDGAFWAYLQRPDELEAELTSAGFRDVTLVAVEGYAWLLGDLADRMNDPGPLLRAVRLAETEPSMLGCSAHIIGVADAPL
jgi:ubiquinone/menaquinone biosynthesis C-methylase UbiE